MDGDTVVNSIHGISDGQLFDTYSDVTINNSVIYGNSGAAGTDGFMWVVGKTTLKDSYFINFIFILYSHIQSTIITY